MTVIKPNSVAGINSITVQSGNSLAIHKSNGELLRTITGTTGVTTFSSISVGTAYTDNSAAKSINIGIGASISQHDAKTLTFGTNGDPRITIDAAGDFNVGTAATIKANGNATFSGIVTATSFKGDGSGLSGISAGTSLSGSTNNTVTTVTGANAIQGESSLTYDGNGILNVTGTGAAGVFVITPDTTDGGIYFNNGSSNKGALTYLHTNETMNFRVNGTNKVSITSGGNIGVGNTVGADFNLLDGVIVNTANGSAGIMINNSSSSHNAYLAFSYGSGAATSAADQFSAYVGRVGDNSLVFGTNNTIRAQVNADGHFVPYANNTYDLGVDGTRWRNVYTNDLNLSNEGSTNSVDGTWGSYTIQEGENDLFLINKRNGKKYKFNLTEVS